MKIELLFLGKTKDRFLADGIAEYAKRLSHYTTLSIKTLKSRGKPQSNDALVKAAEGELLLKNVTRGSFLVALDGTGKQYSSEGLSGLIDQWEQQGRQLITFLIGGPVGLSKEVLNRADLLLSLSRLTFTHDMVRMLLLEQLYRAYTIKRGEKYHK